MHMDQCQDDLDRSKNETQVQVGEGFRNSNLEQAETLNLIEPHICENVPVEVGEPYA
jgi:hypothetical protein